MRAKAWQTRVGGRRLRVGLRVRLEHEEGEGPDRWGPPVGGRERRRGQGGLGRKQKERAGGESWAGQWKKKEEKKKERWARLKW